MPVEDPCEMQRVGITHTTGNKFHGIAGDHEEFCRPVHFGGSNLLIRCRQAKTLEETADIPRVEMHGLGERLES